jgi:hypothetical protein
VNHKITVGPGIVEFDDEGQIISAKTGEGRFSLRADDGVPGTLGISCENGHTGHIQVPTILATLTGKEMNITNACPVCGGKVSAPGGYYQRNEDGVFVRVSGMPN